MTFSNKLLAAKNVVLNFSLFFAKKTQEEQRQDLSNQSQQKKQHNKV